ncbi:SAX-like protein [Mya arenaria]|uniref:SAX-like protein n=1 Tax=Mya arenaria TaxID=6604 RepID=A0ABY7EAK4_MYAAR|nr:SAX-like protein [Mya arenaria]
MLTFLFLSALVAGSMAVIPCPENACALMKCAAVADCVGRVNENGGWCGCCDICMTQLVEGQVCMQTFLLGVPATSECGEGLECSRESGTCVKTVAPCLRRKEEIERGRQNGLPLIGVSEPVCDVNGNFHAVQCFGSVCTCVDREGQQLQDFKADIGSLATMNCQCARDLDDYMKSGLVGKLFYCDANGNYKTTTAAPMEASTAAPATSGSLLGSIVSGMQVINGACAKELTSAQSSGLLGTFVPECDADGMYTPRQCQGSECYCVRKDGTKIEGYSAPISQKMHVTCQCARDKDSYATMGLMGRIHTCRLNGNYQVYQCLGSMCHCTDSAGNRIEGSASSP